MSAMASRILEAEIELVRARAPIDRRDDDAGELAGPVDGRRLPAVLQHGDEMVAGGKPDLVKAGDQRRDAPIPLAIVEANVAVDDRQRIRIACDAGEKAGAEIKHGPRASVVLVPLRLGSERRHCCPNRPRGKCVGALVRVPGEKLDAEGLRKTCGTDRRATLTRQDGRAGKRDAPEPCNAELPAPLTLLID